jgi:hypothetical protein
MVIIFSLPSMSFASKDLLSSVGRNATEIGAPVRGSNGILLEYDTPGITGGIRD